MTPYHQIAELVEWLRSGKAGAESVVSHLDALDADLNAWTERVHSIEPPPAELQDSRELLETSLRGLERFRSAVAGVRAYAESRDESLADAAISEAREGVELILRAKVTTEDSIEQILDEV
jgi:hypothetical protein